VTDFPIGTRVEVRKTKRRGEVITRKETSQGQRLVLRVRYDRSLRGRPTEELLFAHKCRVLSLLELIAEAAREDGE